MLSLRKICLEYGNDDFKEETRILVEEVGLLNLPKLEEFKLEMNRGWLLKNLCEFFQGA